MKYMLDTNICIYIINKNPPHVLHKLLTLKPADVYLSSITLAELRYGVENSQHHAKNNKALDEFILPFTIVDFDEVATRCYGKIRVNLEKRGKLIGPLDLLIAAHAQSLNLTLVTNNKKEFERIEHLKLVDWKSN